VAEVRAFRALRYDEREAGPLEQLVAPPYDVISPEEREEYLARSPYNVVRLTLPDSEDQAAREFADWQARGVLATEEPAFWALQQTYIGPDGVERTRRGLVGALKLEPYDRGVVLPHERTHAGPKEGRLRLLRAVRAQLEPIFLLYEGDPPYEHPTGDPELDVEGARLWPLDAPNLAAAFADKQLLIADGHHRYETALAFHDEDGSPESAWMMVVLVSTRDPGLMIFPTHRLATQLAGELPSTNGGDPLGALEELDAASRDRSAAVVYHDGVVGTLHGDEGELDVTLVERYAPAGVTYTARADEAVAAVDAGRAEAAFLVRPPRIEDVFAVAARGETMPQKTTYFYPKLLSGLLFQPL
jgi:uncharacterized protein (DUF1015 family)